MGEANFNIDGLSQKEKQKVIDAENNIGFYAANILIYETKAISTVILDDQNAEDEAINTLFFQKFKSVIDQLEKNILEGKEINPYKNKTQNNLYKLVNKIFELLIKNFGNDFNLLLSLNKKSEKNNIIFNYVLKIFEKGINYAFKSDDIKYEGTQILKHKEYITYRILNIFNIYQKKKEEDFRIMEWIKEQELEDQDIIEIITDTNHGNLEEVKLWRDTINKEGKKHEDEIKQLEEEKKKKEESERFYGELSKEIQYTCKLLEQKILDGILKKEGTKYILNDIEKKYDVDGLNTVIDGIDKNFKKDLFILLRDSYIRIFNYFWSYFINDSYYKGRYKKEGFSNPVRSYYISYIPRVISEEKEKLSKELKNIINLLISESKNKDLKYIQEKGNDEYIISEIIRNMFLRLENEEFKTNLLYPLGGIEVKSGVGVLK